MVSEGVSAALKSQELNQDEEHMEETEHLQNQLEEMKQLIESMNNAQQQNQQTNHPTQPFLNTPHNPYVYRNQY